jgi:hypothetical protein
LTRVALLAALAWVTASFLVQELYSLDAWWKNKLDFGQGPGPMTRIQISSAESGERLPALGIDPPERGQPWAARSATDCRRRRLLNLSHCRE